jgi:hypothetical protein
MSAKAIQGMVRKCSAMLAEAEQNFLYQNIKSKSERTSLAYWLSRDASVPMARKLRALRMTEERTFTTYANKGFVQHEMKGVFNKFASQTVGHL